MLIYCIVLVPSLFQAITDLLTSLFFVFTFYLYFHSQRFVVQVVRQYCTVCIDMLAFSTDLIDYLFICSISTSFLIFFKHLHLPTWHLFVDNPLVVCRRRRRRHDDVVVSETPSVCMCVGLPADNS